MPLVHAKILSETTNLLYKVHFVGNESTPLQAATACSPVVHPLLLCTLPLRHTGGVRASTASLADQFTLVTLLAFLPKSFLVGAWLLIYSL